MDETLKYYKVTGPDIEQDVVLAIKPEDVEATRERFEAKGYTLEETERPEGAMLVDARRFTNAYPNPCINRREQWEGKCCDRCKNRYNLRSDFCYKHQNDDRCYRFKLER